MCRALGFLLLFALCLGTGAGRAAESTAERALTVDAVLRERATYLSALEWDADAEEAGWFWTQRVLVNAHWNGGDIGGKLTLLSGLSAGIHSSPIEENRLDVQEAYLDIPLGPGSLRAGRQEIKLGSQRLVGWRDGTNVRRTWDGLRYHLDRSDWSIDALYAQEIEVDPEGLFDDRSRPGRSLGGIYATRHSAINSIDLYYLISRRDHRDTIESQDDQRRHSIGTRLFGESGRWFWNWEAVYQFGDQGDIDIRAWTLATNTGYRLDLPGEPAIMLSTNVASGDRQRGDGRLETFDALYPRGSYFSEIAQIGPSNFFNFNPYLTLQLRESVAVSMDLNWFWRLERNDGVYGPPGNIVRAPLGSRERLVSTAFSGAVEWELLDAVRLGFVMTYSRAGDFIEDSGHADNALFTEFSFEVSF